MRVTVSFTFRFRGKESFAFLRHFTRLISIIVQNVISEPVILHFHKIYIQFINLCKVVSYTVRIEDFNSDILSDVEKCCAILWTICNEAPYHAQITYKEYGLALGCNTMEGREQKHQTI